MRIVLPFVCLFAVFAPAKETRLTEIGSLSKRDIAETSGMVQSRKHPGVFWIQSDSNNPANIHAIRANGKVVATFPIAVPNVDWEEISADDDGRLYISDTGNNGLKLPIRVIHRVKEPDPGSPSSTPLPVEKSYFYQFKSKDDRFDCEAIFLTKHHIYLIEKLRNDKEPRLYRLSLDEPGTLLKPAIPERLGKLDEFTEPVTGASRSFDGKRVAVVSTSATRIYDWQDGGRLTLRATVRYKERHIEAIAWDGDDLILATESGELFRLAATDWRN